MLLKKQIQNDFIAALKNKDELIISVLRMLQSAIKNKELEKRTKLSKTEKDVVKLEKLSELTDQEIIEVVGSEIKKRKDAIEQYKLAKRDELVKKELGEIEILKKYLPEQLSETELNNIIDEEIKNLKVASIKDFSRVISRVMPMVKGRADGSLVSKLIKEKLEKLQDKL